MKNKYDPKKESISTIIGRLRRIAKNHKDEHMLEIVEDLNNKLNIKVELYKLIEYGD